MNDAIETTPVEDSESQEQAPVSFLDPLPEDLRGDPSLRNFTDAAGLAKSYVHAQRMIGAEKIALPGKAATEDDWRPVWSKLGAPDSADGYQIAGEGFAEQELQSFKEQAYAVGLTGQQAQQMATYLEGQAKGGVAAEQADQERIAEEYDAELRAEFGASWRSPIHYQTVCRAGRPAWRRHARRCDNRTGQNARSGRTGNSRIDRT